MCPPEPRPFFFRAVPSSASGSADPPPPGAAPSAAPPDVGGPHGGAPAPAGQSTGLPPACCAHHEPRSAPNHHGAPCPCPCPCPCPWSCRPSRASRNHHSGGDPGYTAPG